MRAALLVVVIGCGGVASESDGGDASADGSADSITEKDAGLDVGWTDCRSPDGYQVCYGTHQCAASECTGNAVFCMANFSHPNNMDLTVSGNEAWTNGAARA